MDHEKVKISIFCHLFLKLSVSVASMYFPTRSINSLLTIFPIGVFSRISKTMKSLFVGFCYQLEIAEGMSTGRLPSSDWPVACLWWHFLDC